MATPSTVVGINSLQVQWIAPPQRAAPCFVLFCSVSFFFFSTTINKNLAFVEPVEDAEVEGAGGVEQGGGLQAEAQHRQMLLSLDKHAALRLSIPKHLSNERS